MPHSTENEQLSLRSGLTRDYALYMGTTSRLSVEHIWVHRGVFAELLAPEMIGKVF